MKLSTRMEWVGLTLGVAFLGGCPQAALTIPVAFELGDSLGGFDVQAGEPTQNRGTGALGDNPFTIGRGTLTLDKDAITVTPAPTGGGKGGVNLQAGGSLIVTAWIASVDQLDVVCTDGEQYGPFTVELDENYVPVSVDPSSVTLTQNTIDLINVGEFSLCIEVESPIDGTVNIDTLNFRVGL